MIPVSVFAHPHAVDALLGATAWWDPGVHLCTSACSGRLTVGTAWWHTNSPSASAAPRPHQLVPNVAAWEGEELIFPSILPTSLNSEQCCYPQSVWEAGPFPNLQDSATLAPSRISFVVSNLCRI